MNTNQDYNGWTNYETWNISLWIQNDESLYSMAREYTDYKQFAECMIDIGSNKTPDGVSYVSSKLNISELNEMLAEL